MQREMQTTVRARVLALAVSAAMAMSLLTACQTQTGGRSAPASRPSEVVIWEDPQTGGQGSPVRDANNDPNRFVVIGTNGAVQFEPDGSVCNDCDTTDSTIDVGGNLIDIRFGVASVGDDDRRPYLVDRDSGNFVQLIGGGDSGVTFQVTDVPLEDPNDPSDDLAIAADSEPNPRSDGAGGGATGGLCGALGGILPLFALAALMMRLARQRRRA